jgi:hypothetical protein
VVLELFCWREGGREGGSKGVTRACNQEEESKKKEHRRCIIVNM